ncbi:MAG: hypothetical protein HY429_01905 [Candidatus Levybacteria bacterium]|nr:hypothetical protein [Candidatus Levybacteria bacterium]
MHRDNWKRRIAVDFDGVVHKFRKGTHDESIYDEPNAEVLKGIHELLKQDFIVFIHSARERDKIKEWMDTLYPWFGPRAAAEKIGFPVVIIPEKDEHWHETRVLGITNVKIAALIYIDDHAFHFTGSWEDAMKEWKRRRLLLEDTT